MTKNILGLDLGTNSIGWALIQQDFENKQGNILGMGSRIIPMSQDILGKFGEGNSISQTAERTGYRGVRRLRERHLLRRERLHRVLHLLGFLPKHYDNQIDFTKRFGKFINQAEPKLSFDSEFLFKDSFHEMLADFKQNQPEFLKDKNGEDCLVPYDWTIYYLRKKALTQEIEKEELAWLILNFNQKRGYYQLRGEEEEENPNKLVEFHSLRIVDVVPDAETNKKGETWYSLHLENGWIYRRSSKISLDDWKDKTRDFIVTTDLNDDGSEKLDKEGLVKRSFRAPSADDWTLLKKKTEQDINQSNKTVGTYIYDNLLLNPKQKIKGKLVRTIERKFYKQELEQILKTQKQFHTELQSENLLQDCVRELYRNNEQHQQMLEAKDFAHLFLNDIIFYQRPLRSQKSSISNCTLEFRKSKNENEDVVVHPLKVIAKSNPYYQEFRLLQWMQNLTIYTKDDDKNVTTDFFNTVEDWEDLLIWLHSKKEIKQEQLVDFLLKKKLEVKSVPKAKKEKYRWNYVQDKDYPANETRYLIQSRLDNVENAPKDFLTFENEMALWHIIYSVNDKIEYEKALKSFATKKGLDEVTFVEAFKKFPPFKSDYGSFSEKAIKKLLPLMRFGTQWNWDNIDQNSKERIGKILTGEYDENIKDRVREKARHLNTETDFQALPLWLAQYVVYGRHSEADIAGKWNSVDDLKQYLDDFKQHSLRNPIVEQVITETLRVVKDIWQQFGKGAKDFFSEIHIELGREMKNTADERKRITTMVTDNENTNLRIKALLAEMALDQNVDNVRPYSPMQQEILKIYEEGVLNAEENIDEDILKISKTAQPSATDLKRYKLWLEQKYRSPYTGQMIPLNKLFTPEYEIEHIIPQSRYFDDSMSNKVICEAAVNKLKDNQIGLAFIKNHHGEVVDCGMGKQVKILEVSDYEDFVKQNYNKNRGKRNKLLLEDIPEKMIERQLNDTRYISKYITQLLSNIVRDDKAGSKDDGINSKNIVPGNGKITTRLKQDWGLNDVWNDLVLPRFERMNTLTNSKDFTSKNTHGKTIPTVPIELSKGFSKKRIDHRHHAMDALVIACATRDHVNLLNNESSKSDTKRYDLNRKLRKYEKVTYKDPKTGERIEREVPKDFIKPWATFTEDSRASLENIVISFKQNLRVINKATNYYEKIENGKKVKVEQKGINWAVRKALHKETVSGQVHLDRIKVAKGKILTATRKTLDASFNEKTIESITDTGIQKILLNYLKSKDNKPEVAFSPEGIEELNKNIRLYNDGKAHQPILKVRIFEQGSKFALGETGNKTTKFVEAAKGTNLFFGIYADKSGKRSYETIPLNIVIERQKQGLQAVPEINEKGQQLLFTLSPNDLVYVPEEGVFDENNIKVDRIYKVVSFSTYQCFFVRNDVSTSVVNKVEYSALNKMEKSIDNIMIKENCIKLNVDRLGNISKALK
ncbi:type II CRISPR RNA-guided endonuclease Cas9 [Empedobacter falsenii]|uniref:type II CRISPR RNA-guided endonuclease Cas9 n=1 Tax=Empedobacter falsenii TaxID=343874 RepID=UPI002577767A|nr:type II CRISPR RNA-guided endonuclease Cas9 [Empedobacter falsenii]MDM1299574.1 type II CRISPR RNA-guided endonuclease Cas9 [Empedobacter falsenii]MDM1319367.1 type II CRISPR RNA-guided endonuclease Cas9 [Empedobacter falsenii]